MLRFWTFLLIKINFLFSLYRFARRIRSGHDDSRFQFIGTVETPDRIEYVFHSKSAWIQQCSGHPSRQSSGADWTTNRLYIASSTNSSTRNSNNRFVRYCTIYSLPIRFMNKRILKSPEFRKLMNNEKSSIGNRCSIYLSGRFFTVFEDFPKSLDLTVRPLVSFC